MGKASLSRFPLASDRGHDSAFGLELLERFVDLLPVDTGGLLDLTGTHGLTSILHCFDDIVLYGHFITVPEWDDCMINYGFGHDSSDKDEI